MAMTWRILEINDWEMHNEMGHMHYEFIWHLSKLNIAYSVVVLHCEILCSLAQKLTCAFLTDIKIHKS